MLTVYLLLALKSACWGPCFSCWSVHFYKYTYVYARVQMSDGVATPWDFCSSVKTRPVELHVCLCVYMHVHSYEPECVFILAYSMSCSQFMVVWVDVV